LAVAAGVEHSLALVQVGPRLESPRWVADGAFEFSVRGESGVPYRIEYSADLQTWQALTNVVCDCPMITVRGPWAASAPRRFYRAVSLGWP